MKRLGLLNSYSQFDNYDKLVSIQKFLAGPDNIGNVVYLDYLRDSLRNCVTVHADDVIANPEYFKRQFDALILPFSNMLSEHFRHPIIDVLCDKEIEVILLSIGIQAPRNTSADAILLSNDTIRLLQHARQCGQPIGVRGELSKSVLHYNGFESKVIGCPSVYGIPTSELKISANFKERVVGNCTLSGEHRALTAQLISFIVSNCSGYALQDEYKIIRDIFDINLDDIPFGQFKDTAYSRELENKLFDYGYYNDGTYDWGVVRDYFRRNGFFSVNRREWISYLQNFTCSVGSRFHGNVLAMQSAVPAIFTPCDARTSELIDYHGLPFINDINDFLELDNNAIINKINLFIDTQKKNIISYKDFLSSAGIAENWVW
jgi:hypothetical protein